MNAVTTLAETKLITGEELLAMGDLGPCELIDGRIVEMTLAGGERGYIELNLASELRTFVRQHSLGWVMTGEVGIYTRRNPDRVRGADVVFISKEQLAARPGRGFLEVASELVVEIISPNDRWSDIHEKIEEYFAIGVQRIWIVEPKSRVVRVYQSPTQAQKLGQQDVLRGEGTLSEFTLTVETIFAD